jgi:hypothetical protein
MKSSNVDIGFIFKALGLAMAVASVVLSILKIDNTENTVVLLLGVGLFALSLVSLKAN